MGLGMESHNGQTISTCLWRDYLKKSSEVGKVYAVDITDYKKRLLPVVFYWLNGMVKSKYVVIMFSKNGMLKFVPLLYKTNKIFHRKIFQRVIGGGTDVFLAEHPQLVKCFNSFEVTWVQSQRIVDGLKSLGVKNAEYLDNFRETVPLGIDEIPATKTDPYSFCTFCRVTKTKGITDAIEAIKIINDDYGMVKVRLDIYGPLDEEYKEEFDSIINNCEYISYKGSIPSEEAQDVLKYYYFHLFPTYYIGEGLPGTIIDCLNAGLPTIASDWAYNTEFINVDKTGYIFKVKDSTDLAEKIRIALNLDEDRYSNMRKECLEQAKKFDINTVMSTVISRMK